MGKMEGNEVKLWGMGDNGEMAGMALDFHLVCIPIARDI